MCLVSWTNFLQSISLSPLSLPAYLPACLSHVSLLRLSFTAFFGTVWMHPSITPPSFHPSFLISHLDKHCSLIIVDESRHSIQTYLSVLPPPLHPKFYFKKKNKTKANRTCPSSLLIFITMLVNMMKKTSPFTV